MATLDTEAADALNVLLEDERASVEIEVALAEGATEMYERDAFNAMASADVLSCCELHERVDEMSVPVTRQISGVAWHILGIETYDERLLAFARHQASIRQRTQALLKTVRDRETMRVLQYVADAHARFDGWCEQRAREFAESRLLAFAGNPPHVADAGSSPDGTVSSTSSTTVPGATLVAMQDAALASGPDTGADGPDGPQRDEGDEGDEGPTVDRGASGPPEEV